MAQNARVEIFGQSYTLQGQGTEEEMNALAAYVDSKMREIAAGSMTVETAKIAILAAVHVAHELFLCRAELDRQKSEIEGTAGKLGVTLDQALRPR
ncbi:MAG: cell division protein ZapA [Acidobacteria bacterium]|nr:cell division protein ZapA [Acidobacteriota bacterium]